ncbi:MAG: cytochrome c [Gammaproteobacteria bacterium]|nr:MAG: cytochrome c [Gammaproteobacteria bacterium]
MELGPDGSLYLAEFDGFWDAGPNSKVTRYRWVTGSDAVGNLPNVAHPTHGDGSPGQQIYNARCASCHQASGQGVSGVFPPLAGAKWVVGDASQLVELILDGISGELEVKGVTYNSAMPPWANSLNDEQIAAVLTHIRSSWGNTAAPITAEEVAGVRAR